MAEVQAVLNGLNLFGTDGNGTRWILLEDIDGWDSPETRISTIPPTTMDGAVLGESQYGTRTLLFRGVAKATSEANYWTARNALASATNLIYSTGIITVAEGATTKRVTARRGNLKMKLRSANTFEWAASMLCLDPIKYNNTATSTAYGTVSNAGNFNTYPVITLTSGAAAAVTLTNPAITGSPVVTLTGMNSGDIIDMRNRSVTTSGGVPKYDSVNRALTTWWWLVPGSNALGITGVTANISCRDAWI